VLAVSFFSLGIRGGRSWRVPFPLVLPRGCRHGAAWIDLQRDLAYGARQIGWAFVDDVNDHRRDDGDAVEAAPKRRRR